MLKINRYKLKKRITVNDFLRLKHVEPFATMRQNAKAVNFGFLFGMTAKTFVKQSLETTWDNPEDYIKTNHLEHDLTEIINRNPNLSLKYCQLLTVATDIRKKFFTSYPGLEERIKREFEFAKKHGYVQSWHGQKRRLPELKLIDPKGDDLSLYGSKISNLKNIAANTAIQNFESVLIMRAVVEISSYLRETKKKSYIWGTVHDSIDLCIHKEELKEVAPKLEEICTKNAEEYFGMPMAVDITISDLKKGDIYKSGKDWKSFLHQS